MGRWLALLSTAALIIAAATIDPCKRQPFRGRCPSVSGQPPKRSQFVLRYYARNGECVSYPYGHCATDDSEPQLYRYKEECEDSCINNTPENLGQPKSTSDDNQTYGTLSPKEKESLIVVETAKTEKKTTITSPPTTFKTSESTTSSTTTESVTTTEKATTTEEPVTTTEKITIPITAAETSTTTTHVTTESVAEVTEAEEEVEEEENNVEDEEHVQETTTTPAPTTARATTSAARTECERRREASASSKIRGGFVPVCESNGNFQKVQCEPDGRQCFCVNSNGIEITNSRTRNGIRPDCARIETAVTPKTQSCTGRADRGPCSSSYTRFYYDEATQKCATFPYSGCGGNGNNFETESECNHRCVPAKPAPTASAPSAPATVNDICRLPKERGPCDKYELRFYFNAETKECKYFFWGGCEGNGNNFETAEQCQSSCGVAKANQHNVARTSSQNNGQIKTIPGVRIGNGTVVTGVSGDLEIATPTATAPTTATPTLPQRTVPPTHPTTRFVPQTVQTRASQPPPPQQTAPPQTTRFVSTTTPAPVPPPTPAPIPPNRPAPVVLPGDSEEVDVNRCDHPLDSGSCRGQFVRWFWDNQKQACDVFTYSGCEGNGNNFASREECMAICQREAPPPPSPDFSNVCKHEIDAGECQGVFQRFAFDTEEGECRPFTYGGCGGNGNNFATLAECRTKCEKPPSQAVNVCEFEIEAGECTGVFPRFAYDRETNDCRPFTYGGCGGNGNNFANVNECRNICIKKACNPLGQCDLSHCQVLNDSRGCPFCSCAPVKAPVPVQCPPMDMDRCMEPCIVITNRRGCQECACPQGVSTTAQAPVAPARQPGPPSPSTQPPRPPGHPTRIEAPAAPSRPGEKPRTIPGVESTRTPLSPAFTEEIQEKCLQPMETGPCKSFVDRWFFNREDGSCHPFKYGGCAGNRNHFFTQRECEIHCARFLREQSEEESREEEEPARPVAHGVSRVHVVEPLPVENYHSPEPVLRGAYGKKYLEPATTQGVKITTSTARPTTATTTPTTTTSTTTTAKTTPKIEEVEEEPEEEEEEPEEITTTNGSTTTTQVLKQPKEVEEEAPETKDIGREESSEPQETPSESPESEMEEEEPEEIPELSSAPTTRASRLPVSREESKTEDNESEEEVGEENVSTPVTSPITEAETTTKASSEPAPTKSSTSAATETATEKPEVETTLFNEVNSMEGEEGVEENEITPSSMMSSSKFAVHRQTEEEKKFDEITADLKANPDEKLEVTPKPGLKKVEITPPTMAPATATAPTNEAPTTEAAAVESVSTTAEPSITSGTVQTRAQNIEVTDSTTAATSTASTTQTPTTATTTQSRATTATDSNENEPDFDMTAIKPDNSNSVKAGGLAQQPVDKAVDPTSGIGRQPIPGVTLPDDSSLSTEDLDLEEPTTIFPNPKPTAMVRQTLAPTQASSTSPNTVAQSNKPFNSHDPKIVCSMPAEQGLCNSYVARWFFNYQTGQCEEFSYGGCSGNANNFGNRTLCELTCMPVRSVTSQVPERCSYEKDAGFGKGYNVKWYFNMRNLRCEQFVYEGKGGNDNKFETLSDCERFCSPQPARPVPQRPTLATVPTVPATQAATTLRTAAPTAATLPPSVKTHAAATSRPVPPASPIPTVAPTVPNKLNTLVTLPPVENDNKDSGDDEDYEEVPDDEPMPPIATTNIGGHGANELVQPPGTEPQPPSARGSPVQPVEKPLPVIPTTAATSSTAAPTTQQPIYNANKIVPSDMEDKDPSLRLVGASPKEEVNYSTGRRDKAAGIATFNENRLPPPDLDSKNEDDKFARPSCPNGNKELRYLDGRPVMCLPGKAQCPDRAVCYFNGMDYFCCPNEEDPYDRHVFGGYGGDEARYGYKVFGPLRISRLMDEVPLRAKRQTTMDRAFNTNAASFNLDSVVAPLRFDAEKPRHVSSAARMNRPTVPKHGNPMCILPLVKGECDAAHLRYYYDRNSDSCRLFYYSGCQGNANNFGSLIDCQRLCVLGGQTAPAVQADAVTPATIVAPGQCPDGAPLGGSAPVLCGNSTESIGCPTGYYCRGGPPDICCRGIDPALRNVQHGVKLVAETIPTPGVPRSYYKQSILATPKYMCPDASDPLMAENNEPAVCGAGFDGVKMCPKGYYCAIDGAKGSRLCCPLFGSSASRIPHEYNVIAPSTPRKPSTSREVLDREPLPSGQEKYHQESSHSAALPQPKAEEEDDEEYEDDDAAQQLKIKSGSRNRELQEQAASESSKAADVSKESVNIDIPKEEPVVEETTEPTETPVKQSSDMSICQLKPTEGRACREDEKAPRTNLHYFYSAKDHRCKLYFYRGCGGNENRFEKKADCEALCLNP